MWRHDQQGEPGAGARAAMSPLQPARAGRGGTGRSSAPQEEDVVSWDTRANSDNRQKSTAEHYY